MFVLAIALILQGSIKDAVDYKLGVPLPYWGKWGQYIVVIEQLGPDPFDSPQRLRILDEAGRSIKEIVGPRYARVGTIDVTGKGAGDLYISNWSGGAYCCTTEWIFSKRDGVRNILSHWGRHLGIHEFADLNGDGRQEIIVASPALQKFSGWQFSRSHNLQLVWEWNGKQLADATGKYPKESKRYADWQRKMLLETLAHKEYEKDQQEWIAEGQITGYYANMAKIGKGALARKWLMKEMPSPIRKWLVKHEQELLSIVKRTDTVPSDQRPVIRAKDPHD